MNKKLYCSALCALLGGILLTSCTNDLNELNGNKGPQTMPGSYVYTPDVVAWSGNQILGNTFTGSRSDGITTSVPAPSYAVNNSANTRGTRSNGVWDGVEFEQTRNTDGVISWVIVETPEIDRTAENELVKEVLPEKQDNLPKVDADFLYFAKSDIEFEFYPVHSVSEHNYSKDSQNGHNQLGLFYYDKSKELKKVILWDPMSRNPWNQAMDPQYITRQREWPNTDQYYSRGVKIRVPKGYKFGFFWEGRFNQHDKTDSDPEGNYVTTYYSAYDLNKECYKTDENGNLLTDWEHRDENPKSQTHAGTFVRNNRTYMGIEDWTDFDYQDWVFGFDRVMDTVDTDNPDFGKDENGEDIFKDDPVTPPTPNPCPNDGKCEHPETDHNPDGSCDLCPDDEGCNECPNKTDDPSSGCDHGIGDHHKEGDKWVCDDPLCEAPDCHPSTENPNPNPNPDPSNPSTPDQPGKPKPTGNEVEINFALNDIHTNNDGSYKYDIADLVSKLSIHVRYPHDVEVIIPVPEYLYCDLDDFLIMQNHNDFIYGGSMTENRSTYVVEDKANNKHWEVSLGVQFVGEGADQLTTEGKGYIRVYTSGIGEELIDYLQKTNGDGINFEVYNYYNRGNVEIGNFPEIDYQELQYKYLSHSFVNFDWNESGEKKLPDNYINAFNTVGGQPNPGDCYMWIIGDEHALLDNVYKEEGAIISRIDNGSYNINWSDNERSSYGDPYQGPHYNNGNLNWIYTLKTIDETNYTDMPKDGNWPFQDSITWWQSICFGGKTDFKCSGLINWHK
ncbi:MAG: hypothetical protein J1F43_07500 [Muribaculaceae bacterium]|nr:hypothetical protein [Muribaculaceae bacterium]